MNQGRVDPQPLGLRSCVLSSTIDLMALRRSREEVGNNKQVRNCNLPSIVDTNPLSFLVRGFLFHRNVNDEGSTFPRFAFDIYDSLMSVHNLFGYR